MTCADSNPSSGNGSREPFVGIKPYTLAQADIFYERQEEARSLLETILTRRLVLLYGESGNGKSSLINAGLVPMLTNARFRQSLQPEILRIDPGLNGVIVDRRPLECEGASKATPFHSLFKEVQASAPQPGHDTDTFCLPMEELIEQLVAYLRPPVEAPVAAVNRVVNPGDAPSAVHAPPHHARRSGPGRHVLLMFDQFEELHTFAGERAAFSLHARRDSAAGSKSEGQLALARKIGELLRARLKLTDTTATSENEALEEDEPELPVKFLFVFREEYLVKLQALLPELLSAAPYRLPSIPSSRLTRVMEGPFTPEDTKAKRAAAPFAQHELASFYSQYAKPLSAGFQTRTDGLGQNVLTELQVVCIRLWRSEDDRKKVSDVVATAPASEQAASMAVAIDEIIRGHFLQALETLGNLKGAALDVLCELVTSDKTRNIMSEASLREKIGSKQGAKESENAGKHTPEVIKGVLQKLSTEKFINRAERSGTVFFDIASESLIPWLGAKRQARLSEIEARRIRAELDEQKREADRRKQLRLWIGIGVIGVSLAAFGGFQSWRAMTEAKAAKASELKAKAATLAAKEAAQDANEAKEAAQVTADRAEKERSDTAKKYEVLQTSADGITGKIADLGKRIGESDPELKRIQVSFAQLQQKLRDPLIARFASHRGGINEAQFSPDGRYVVTASDDKYVKVWDTRASKETKGVSKADLVFSAAASSSRGGVRTAAFVPDTDYLITGSAGQSVRIFRWRQGPGPLGEVAMSDATGDSVIHVEFNPADTAMAVVGREDGACRLLRKPSDDPKTWVAPQAVLKSWQTKGNKPVMWASFSHDGSKVVTSSDDGFARVYSTVAPYDQVTEPANCGAPTRKMIFSPVDERIVAGGAGMKVIYWRAGHGSGPELLDSSTGGAGHIGGVTDVAFSPDGRFIASVGADGQCIVWDVTTKKGTALPVQIHGRLFGVDWRGDLMAIVGEDGGLEVWHYGNGDHPQRWLAKQAHIGVAWGVSFSPDAKKLLTWSDGDLGSDNVPSPKGAAATWTNPIEVRSDFTAALWDMDVVADANREGY